MAASSLVRFSCLPIAQINSGSPGRLTGNGTNFSVISCSSLPSGASGRTGIRLWNCVPSGSDTSTDTDFPSSSGWMSNKLFVGNLSFNTTENDLNDLFAAHGTVTETNLMMDRETGRPRGFGFVTMSSAEEAQKPSQPSTAKMWAVAPSQSTWPSPVKNALPAAVVVGANAINFGLQS
jgi:hypothetical protein